LVEPFLSLGEYKFVRETSENIVELILKERRNMDKKRVKNAVLITQDKYGDPVYGTDTFGI